MIDNLLKSQFQFVFRTWSSVPRTVGDTGWPDSSSVDVGSNDKDWPATTAASQAFTDLVPEFEPGKPWKVILENFVIYSHARYII